MALYCKLNASAPLYQEEVLSPQEEKKSSFETKIDLFLKVP